MGNDGNFYGTTINGGGGFGTVSKGTTNGTLTTLVTFNNINGANPYGGLTPGNDGNFYGTTYSGGTNGSYGTVFKVTANGTLTSLFSFNNSNGANPYAGLMLGNDGNFYGTTLNGGSSRNGVIFRLGNPPSIMVQPASRTNIFNSPTAFNASAVGGLPLSYQWRKNGVNMTDDFLFVNGSQTASLSLSEVSSTDAADYSVVVTNNYGSVTSAVATLTFRQATPFITWFNPSPITYGTALSSSAIASFGAGSVPGSYVYTPPPGTVLNTGTNTVCVVFAPTDTVDFSSVTSCVSVVVLPVPLTVTASNVTRAYGQLNPVFAGTITGLQNGDNITAKYSCSATATNLPGTYPIVPSLVDSNNLQTNYLVSLVSGTLTVTNSAILVVSGLQVTPSGFIASFNQLVDASVLGLYTTNPAVFTALGTTSGLVQGSLVHDTQATQVTFIKSGGPLVPDTYTVRLLSATNNYGFRNLAGLSLDGDADGVPGGDYVTQVTVAPFSARVVSMPDFARGPGQPVNIPASGRGIPVSFSDGSNVLATSFTIEYDPALLHVTGAALGTNLPPGWTLNYNLSMPGFLPVLASGATPLATGQVRLATIQADIPWSAPYARLGIVNLTQAQANGGTIPVIGDSAVQVIGFLGDVDGDRSYTTNDAYLIAQLAVQLINGFSAYPSADPVIIADVNGDGTISILDALLVSQMSQGAGGGGFIPNLPLPDLSSASANNQLTISWPQGADGYVLEQSGTLDLQSSWIPVTNTPVISGGQQTVTLTPTGNIQFYRLRK